MTGDFNGWINIILPCQITDHYKFCYCFYYNLSFFLRHIDIWQLEILSDLSRNGITITSWETVAVILADLVIITHVVIWTLTILNYYFQKMFTVCLKYCATYACKYICPFYIFSLIHTYCHCYSHCLWNNVCKPLWKLVGDFF